MHGLRLAFFQTKDLIEFRKTYASTMDKPCLLRPWMLAFRSDFGISGFLDPEVGELLVQLIMTEGSAT